MELYVCQVKTGEEKKYIQLFSKLYPQMGTELRFYTPQRQLKIRRGGRVKLEKHPMFPGYVFLETQEITPELYTALRSTDGLFRILPENHRIQPLPSENKELLSHLIHRGEVLELSKVNFREDGRIQVLSGPLEGLEGSIVKVDRRKQRARIRLDMYETSHVIDLGFEEIQPAQELDTQIITKRLEP